MATLPLRQIEGKYEILEKIKEGGMGAIYKVRHRLLDEIRVVKVMRPQIADSEELQQRFAREARAAIRLKHPNIAQLYDFAVEPDGIAYMVMEFIDGVTLQEMLARNGPAPLDLTLEMARQGLEALRYLHAHGYVHRDVAPDNLMLTKDFAGQPQVKLIDLGIVKHLAGGGEGLTATGTFLGKVRYSSPEQFSGEKGGLDQRSDLYSFGVMLYELLTGKCPIVGENLSQLVAAHLFQPPLSFQETDPAGRVPEEIRTAVMRSLVKTPAERIGSARELQELLVRQQRTQNLSQDLESTLATTLQLRTGGDRSQPGTTQDRLDAQFGMVQTPGPGAGLRAADPVSTGTAGEQLAKLLATAQRLAKERRWEEARLQLYQALALDPDHADVRELLTTVETSHQQAIAEEKQRKAIADAVERVEVCLREERPDDAKLELDHAVAELGSKTELSRLKSRIAELRAGLAERARQLEIGEAVVGVGTLLDAEQAEPASAALDAAEKRFGKEDAFAALRLRLAEVVKRLDDRRREQEAAARRERVRALLGEAAALAGTASFAEAIARTERALAIDPEDATAQQALTGYRAREAERLEEIRRQRALSEAIATAVAAVESHLARESADDAQRALDEATRRLGDDERLRAQAGAIARLRADLAERQRQHELEQQRLEQEERQRQQEEQRRLEAERKKKEEAQRKQEEARLKKEAARLKEEQDRVAREKEARRQAEELRQREEERLRLEAEARRQEEERRLREEAEARQKEEERRLRQEAEARAKAEEKRLRDEAEARRQAEEKRQHDEAEARRKAEEKRQRDEAEARRKAEEKRQRDEAEALQKAEEKRQREEAEARRKEEERRQREEEEARRAEAEKRRQRGEALLRTAAEQAGRGDLAKAIETARGAIELAGDAARAATLKYEQALEAEQRAKRLEQLLVAAQRDLDAGHAEPALARLEAGRDEHGAEGAWRELLKRAQAEIARQEAERKRQQAVESEVEAVDRLIEKGRFEKAEKRLEKARAELGDADAWRGLAQRIASALVEKQRLAQAPAPAPRVRAEGDAKARAIKPAHLAAAAGVVLALAAGAVMLLRSDRTEAPPPGQEAVAVQSEIAATDPSTDPRSGAQAAPPAVPPSGDDRETQSRVDDVAGSQADPGVTDRAATAAPAPEPVGERKLEERGEQALAEPPARVAQPTPPRVEAKRAESRSGPEPATAPPQTRPREAAKDAPSSAAEPAPRPVEVTQLPVEEQPVKRPQPTTAAVRPPPPPAPAQPAAQAAAPPAVAPPPRVADEREALLATLGRYRAAYESLDAAAVTRVFTGADVKELQRAFRQYKSMSVQIDLGGCQTSVDGDRATAACSVTRIIDPKAGQQVSRTQRETFQLRRAGSSWIVEAVR